MDICSVRLCTTARPNPISAAAASRNSSFLVGSLFTLIKVDWFILKELSQHFEVKRDFSDPLEREKQRESSSD